MTNNSNNYVRLDITSLTPVTRLIDILKGNGMFYVNNPWFKVEGIESVSITDYLTYKNIGSSSRSGMSLNTPEIYYKHNDKWINKPYIRLCSNSNEFSIKIFKPYNNDNEHPITTTVNKLTCSLGLLSKTHNSRLCIIDSQLCQALELILYLKFLRLSPSKEDTDETLIKKIIKALDTTISQDDIDTYLNNFSSNNIYKVVKEKGDIPQYNSDEFHDLALLLSDATSNYFKSIKRGKVKEGYDEDIYKYMKSNGDFYIKPSFTASTISFKDSSCDLTNAKMRFSIDFDNSNTGRWYTKTVVRCGDDHSKRRLRNITPDDLMLDTQPKFSGQVCVTYKYDLRSYKVGIVNGSSVDVIQIKLTNQLQSNYQQPILCDDDEDSNEDSNEDFNIDSDLEFN